ncbi:PIG-L deacetylase family protein [Nakamurella leprariae]|uniref:PIG-L family deacetylase n=1 Tax=Nakamurella leprariae TaxID=2803911 RepID=A0A938YEM4_9ACTN|nr:PIG-L family deacetylase [Nakamurella leprariae]MBM9467017.1 PIG-L family deacetylase [Nakamurella leprariae]
MAPDLTGDLGDVLGVFAHPDDEAYLAAGLLARAVDAGRRVTCITATRGEAGFGVDDPRPPADRAAVRTTELAACLAILGVTDHRWFDYPDGGCAGVDDAEAADRIAAVVREVRPDTVLTFGPDGGTGHPDHVAVCRWTTLALSTLADPPRLLHGTKTRRWTQEVFGGTAPAGVMMVDGLEPERVDEADLAVWFTCDDELLDRKIAALRAQASQVEPFIAAVGLPTYRAFNREEFFRAPTAADAGEIERARGWAR